MKKKGLFTSSVSDGLASNGLNDMMEKNRSRAPDLPSRVSLLEDDLTSQVIVFTKKKRKYEYVGTTNAKGKPEGRGELRYPDSSVYEGEFCNGYRDGLGTYHFSTDTGGFAHGQWKKGVPDEDWKFWKIQYGEHVVYFGNIRMENKSRKEVDMLSIHDFMKHGEGEIYYAKHNIKYFGSFEGNQRNGYGVMIFGNGDRYYGGFKDDRYSELGTYLYKDGSTFHGRWKDGKKSGKGMLLLATGDRIEGKWNGETIDNALFTKGDCQDVSSSTLTLLLESVNDALRKSEYDITGGKDELSLASSAKWKQYVEMYRSKWTKQQQDMGKKIKMNGGINSASDFLKCVQRFLSDKDGFLCRLIQFFQSSFMGSYHITTRVTDRKHPKLQMPFAIDDVRSFIHFLASLFASFFGDVYKLDKFRSYKNLLLETISEWIHDRSYSTLFSIYEAQFEDQDLLLKQKIDTLRSSSLASIGITDMFTPVGYDVHAEFGRMTVNTPYYSACKMLEEIRNKTTPAQKIEVLAAVRESVMFEMRSHRKAQRKHELGERYTPKQEERDENWQPGADDVSPPICFVWLQASITNHYAHFHYINDWKLRDVELNPVQWMISFYEGFSEFVLDLDPNLRRGGVLVSNYQMRKAAEESIDREMDRCKSERRLPPTFFWLPQVFMHIQLTVGSNLLEVPRLDDSNTRHGLILPRDMLARTIVKYYESAQYVLKNIKDIGFTFELRPRDMDQQQQMETTTTTTTTTTATTADRATRRKQEQQQQQQQTVPTLDTHDVWIIFDVVYPSHIYADLSLSVTRFLRFDMQFD